MITYWQQIDGQFTKTKKDEINTKLPLWVDARNVTRDETNFLQEEYQIEQDHILDILDPDELSRIEDGDSGYILTIVRVPFYDPAAETPYFTGPVGIIIKGKTIITICWTDCEVLKDFGSNRVRNVRLNDFPSFIVHIINRANLNFLRYLKEINRTLPLKTILRTWSVHLTNSLISHENQTFRHHSISPHARSFLRQTSLQRRP